MGYFSGGFSPRFTAPLKNNHCYYSSNIFYNSGYGMPNCTAYAWGRAYEILKQEPELSLGNAGDWYGYNKENKIYSYGDAPKIGAIACFDNADGGHVAVVEKIENDVITFSNSAYGGSNFYLSYADIDEKNPGQDGWIFQGYIYLKEIYPEASTLDSYRKVTCPNGLNFREGIGTGNRVLSVIPKNTKIYVTDIYFYDNYIWGETVYKGQVGYCAIDYTDNA